MSCSPPSDSGILLEGTLNPFPGLDNINSLSVQEFSSSVINLVVFLQTLFKQVHVLLMLGVPKVDAALQAGSHESRGEESPHSTFWSHFF